MVVGTFFHFRQASATNRNSGKIGKSGTVFHTPVMQYIFYLLILSLGLACTQSQEPVRFRKGVEPNQLFRSFYSSSSYDLGSGTKSAHQWLINESRIKEIFGYRLTVWGDFNGDGQQEKLSERYLSRKSHAEANKFYEGLDYGEIVGRTMDKMPESRLVCSDSSIGKFVLSHEPQLFGLSYLQNEGDLDGNGTDEISYVLSYADWSSVNSCHIATYTDEGWEDLATFEIRDWQLPFHGSIYGFMGVDTFWMTDSIQNQIAHGLQSFNGFIEKEKDSLIRIQTFDGEAMEVNMALNLYH
jgi:hypothetical protein